MNDDRVTCLVEVPLRSVIDCGGMEGFLDLLEDLFFANDELCGILSDIIYKLVGTKVYGGGATALLIEVSGYVDGTYDDAVEE